MRNYTHKEEVENFVYIHGNKPLNELFELIEEKQKEIEQCKVAQNSCNSDLIYWSYVATIDTYSDELEILQERVWERIKEKFIPKKMISDVENYTRIMENKKKVIKDLKTYTPHGYKKTIEIINKIFE